MKNKKRSKSLSCLTQDAGFLEFRDHVNTKFLRVSVQVYVKQKELVANTSQLGLFSYERDGGCVALCVCACVRSVEIVHSDVCSHIFCWVFLKQRCNLSGTVTVNLYL